MKKVFLFPVIIAALFISACDELGDLIPDVDEVLTETYNITISENMEVVSGEQSFIDISEYDEYQEYSEYIDDYLINKLTYEILNYSAPEDLYFVGAINFYGEDSTAVKTLGEIPAINLADIAALGEEQEVAVDTLAAIELITLLKESGTFNIQFTYELQTGDGALYQFEEADYGTGFDLKTNVYITMLTGAGNNEFNFNLK